MLFSSHSDNAMSTPSSTEGGRSSQDSLCDLLVRIEASLIAFHDLLSDPETASLLSQSLHSDTVLPDSNLLLMSQRIVDLLGLIEHQLEPAALRLADYFLGYTTTKCLVSAVQLNIADHLSHGPLSLSDLAGKAQADPQRLGQILRPLYTSNIFGYDANTGMYCNNRVSELIRADHRTQWRNWVELYGNQFYDIAAGIPQFLGPGRGTRSAAQHVFDTDDNMFTYFQSRGWVPQLHKTLGAGAEAMAPGILADYPWHELANTTVIDVGGGGGALIASLLRGHPTMKGGIYDLPSVIDHVRSKLAPGGPLEDVGPRLTCLVGGDFLKEVPASSAYTMKWCLHDWSDADASLILQNIRAAIQPAESADHECRLVILESVLSDRRSGRLSVYGDINMMMTAKGHERTEEQWRTLVTGAGWVVHSILPLRNAWVQAIDLRPGPATRDDAAGPTPDAVAAESEAEQPAASRVVEPESLLQHPDQEGAPTASNTKAMEGETKLPSAHSGNVEKKASSSPSAQDTGCEKRPQNSNLQDSATTSSIEAAANTQTTDLKRISDISTPPAPVRQPEVMHGDVEADGRVVLYIIKADQTSYINYIKPLILALELQAPHVLSVVDTKDEWYSSVHPQRMVPALKDRDPSTGEACIVFESTACLQYLCERFDPAGTWSGRTAAEKGSVMAWTAYQTAALGPTAKYWLYFLRGYPNRQNPTPLPKTIEQLHKDTLRQWDILEQRLSQPGQAYIALKDRATIADLSYLPFSMPYMFALFSVRIEDWPHVHKWSQDMLSRPAVKAVLERAPTLGHGAVA
ncbi:hypothetical protein M0657_005113 [Pyricularia oryzae]|nr:hypothetical protein M9X92_010038 [Pyricularia oryzae]KAI7923549.1 hypothetical protein M0657_005113 [Pyricularia oryzae]